MYETERNRVKEESSYEESSRVSSKRKNIHTHIDYYSWSMARRDETRERERDTTKSACFVIICTNT